MYEDLPPDVERLDMLAKHLQTQLDRVREQWNTKGTAHGDLPGDPAELDFVGKWIALTLRRVKEQREEADTGTQPWRSGRPPGFVLQHVRTGENVVGKGILHRPDCPMADGKRLSWEDARLALQERTISVTEPCTECRPDEDLRAG
ncbi:DUF6233 domain-containing protein [Actinacidiphila sp. bgisy160]|uniref:DUF6233 domain-containing protein n=1 Tax=Actinacidiphila sp. bgisy160 TaxID=3413796 RepID=UPI003D73B92F